MTTARRGQALTEVIVATLIVGVVLVAAMRNVGGTFRSRLAAVSHRTGPALAHDLMSEILQNAHDDPETPGGPMGPDSGEAGTNRGAFDDIDDYQGWASSSPVDKTGTPLALGVGWQRQSSVTFFDRNTQTATAADSSLKRVTVTVISPTGESTTITAFRSPIGLLEHQPSAERNVVSRITVGLQTTGQREVLSGVSVENHSFDN